MIDSGASSCLTNTKLVQEYNLPTNKKQKPRRLRVIDGCDISSGLVDTECEFVLKLGSHVERINCNVADIGYHSIVLAISWLKLHNPSIDWPSKQISFVLTYCSTNCVDSAAMVVG